MVKRGNRAAAPLCGGGARPCPRRAFTLIELLVVIAIIALLVSLLMPSLRQAKELAKEAVCRAHYHAVGPTISMYSDDNEGYMCPYVDHFLDDGRTFTGPDNVTYSLHSRYALVTCWYKPGPYTDPIRGGDGFLGKYTGTNFHRVSKRNLLSCPSYPEGPITTVLQAYARPYEGHVYRAKSFSHNLGTTTTVDGKMDGQPRRLESFSDVNNMVLMCDGSATNIYVRTPSDPNHSGLDVWQLDSSVPIAKHLGNFSMLFLDAHVDGGAVEQYYRTTYFDDLRKE